MGVRFDYVCFGVLNSDAVLSVWVSGISAEEMDEHRSVGLARYRWTYDHIVLHGGVREVCRDQLLLHITIESRSSPVNNTSS